MGMFFLLQSTSLYLGVEVSDKLKVTLEVGGEDSLDDKKAKAIKLALVQVTQPVKAGVGEVETPC